MGELVEGNIPALARVGGAMQDVIPGNDDCARSPGFAEPHLMTFCESISRSLSYRLGCVRIGIDENRLQSGIVVMSELQQKDASVGSNRDFDFVGQFKTAASLEVFLRYEDLNQSLQLLLLGR